LAEAGAGAETTPKGTSVWRNRNLLILVAGQWVSQVGNTLFSMAVYWFVLSDTGSRADLGYVGSILSLAGLAGLLAGALVDRWDRRRTMVWTDVVRAVLSLVLVAAALVHTLPVAFLVGCVFLMTLVGTLFSPAEAALVPAVVADQDLVAASGLNQSATSLAQLVGASFGGVVLGLLGPVVLFGFNGLSFAVSVASLLLLRVVSAPPRAATAGSLGQSARALWSDVMRGQRVIWKSPWLRRTVPISLIVNFSLAPVNYLDVAWVRQVLHLGAVVYGLFGVAILVGMLAGAVATAAITARVPLRTILPVGLAAAGLCIVVLSRVPVVAPDLAVLFAFGLFVGVLNTALAPALQRAVPDHLRGRVFGTVLALSTMANPLGALLAGLAAAVVPLGAVFLGAGLLMTFASLLILGLPQELTLDEATLAA
jgi:MFS transporter, DHA3 family, macrolide efflux protein